MRVPTLAWWPGTIPGGITTKEIGVTTDLLPTLAKLTNAQFPTDRIIDGKEITGILLGKKEAKSPHHVLFYEDEGIRRGDWKLVKKKVKGKTRLELYDLYEDLGEKKNMSNAHPEMVEELDRLLKAHASSIAANLRPAGFAKNPKPILNEVRDCSAMVTTCG